MLQGKKLAWVFLSIFAFALSSVPSFADAWEAVKLRGAVFALENGGWQQLKRGDVVADERHIRTGKYGRVQFRRGSETIDLGADTEIQIMDRDGQKYTVVRQNMGVVTIEADVRKVQHFAVQNDYLAALVKGTKFTVTMGDGSAKVDVSRGQVEVRDLAHKLVTQVRRGQSARAGTSEKLHNSGGGAQEPISQYSGNGLSDEVTLVTQVLDDVVEPVQELGKSVGSIVNNLVSGGSSSASNGGSSSGSSGNGDSGDGGSDAGGSGGGGSGGSGSGGSSSGGGLGLGKIVRSLL